MVSRSGIGKTNQPELEPDAWDRFEKAMDRLLKRSGPINDAVTLSAGSGLSVSSLGVLEDALLPGRLNPE